MSQREASVKLPDSMTFDVITQSCEKVETSVDMDVNMTERMSAARSTAHEVLGDQATDDDAKLFLDEIDDSWLRASLDEEHTEFDNPCNAVEIAEQSNVSCVSAGDVKVDLAGLREVPLPQLADAGNGIERMKSHKNNNWALRRADKLRHALGWDMRIAFGDLPLTKVDELLANLFSRVVKIKGGEYPAESLTNMLGGYNRLLRRASDLRSLKNPKAIPLGKDFCIKKHPAFVRTRLTLAAAIGKTAKDGTNKKRQKVNHVTEAMETAVLADVDHQIFHNEGCQKRTAFYLLVRCGIRGGDELWQLKYYDLAVKIDKYGREYVQYMERESKNNQYTIERTKEEQFRKPYHSYEADFILTAKQYLRHMPPWVEGNNDALFLGCIKNPASIVWFNRAFRVGKGTSVNWLKNMLKLVGLPENLFSNKSGRATLVTRLAAAGVPDHVGMLLTGHHTADGYGRYDRTKDLQQEAAALVVYNPSLSYETALAEVSKRFVKEDLRGSGENLKPLIYVPPQATGNVQIIPSVSEASSSNQSVPRLQTEASIRESALQVQAGTLLRNLGNQVPKQIQDRPMDDVLKLNDSPKKLEVWNNFYDGIDWEAAMRRDPKLAAMLGGGRTVNPIANVISNCQNCTITINVPPTFNPSNFDWAKILASDKENRAPQDNK